MEKIPIKTVTVYEFSPTSGYTYITPTTVAKVGNGAGTQYVIPYGIDYECDGGHHVEIIGRKEFKRRYSLSPVNP